MMSRDSLAVPLVTSHKTARVEQVEKCFHSKYQRAPDFVVRVPGRVNLIGEHIDYCGYPVFPMAIEQDITVAVSATRDDKIVLCNHNDAYDDYTADFTTYTIDKASPKWYHYFLCGIKGVIEHFKLQSPTGMQVFVLGTIPPCAGLSSSSALVCAAALATAQLNKLECRKHELANLCARSERYIGTEGGGMDQAIAFLASQGTAKLISFNPLSATDVKLPEGATFVIANSLTQMNKAATSHFNSRVAECRLAAKVLAKLNNIPWEEISQLGPLHSKLGVSLTEMIEQVSKHLHVDRYTKNEICDILGITEAELNEKYLSEKTRGMSEFTLHQRAMHVFSEARRVYQFREICESQATDSMVQLGKLMQESHESCRDLYECSHSQLDKLVELSKDKALGARLTGAGWGGCIVALVESKRKEEYMKHLQDNFYCGDLTGTELFPTPPGDGALIFTKE